jgi:hypothetical protein
MDTDGFNGEFYSPPKNPLSPEPQYHLSLFQDVLVLSLSLSRTLDWAHDHTFPEISGHAASVALARHNIASLLSV